LKRINLTSEIIGYFHLSTNDQPLERHAAVIELWQKFEKNAKGIVYIYDDQEITIHANWKPLIAHLKNHYKFSEKVYSSPKGITKKDFSVIRKEVSIPVRIKLTEHNKLIHTSSIAEAYLYDVFMIVNLSIPGAADFLNARINEPKSTHQSDLRLSSYYFEEPFNDDEKNWPCLQVIDIDTVAKWYNHIRHSFTQIPNSPIEKAIFALLHVCKSDGVPADIIWLFYAFESLFQTRVGENFSSIVERIGLLLEPNAKQEKHMRKQLRLMYDYRSKFVHGGLAVIHPMHNEQLDKRVNDEYGTTIELSIYGTRLLVVCIQKFAEKNWTALAFKTSLQPTDADTKDG
jgi:hypothetical protein